jgi:hypothetical protein
MLNTEMLDQGGWVHVELAPSYAPIGRPSIDGG